MFFIWAGIRAEKRSNFGRKSSTQFGPGSWFNTIVITALYRWNSLSTFHMITRWVIAIRKIHPISTPGMSFTYISRVFTFIYLHFLGSDKIVIIIRKFILISMHLFTLKFILVSISL